MVYPSKIRWLSIDMKVVSLLREPQEKDYSNFMELEIKGLERTRRTNVFGAESK
jgi:hypothetical protein